MTLEDFFTLTEIKDGLTVTSRVEELVSVMQRSKDSVVKSAGDASRHWAAVASTIAATKNKECLDAFVRLDGLFYFNRWLVDAQKLASDLTDGSIDEAIVALLQALENLGVDGPKLINSGIRDTVKNLDDHRCSRIQDLARKLFDSWKQGSLHDRSECNDANMNRLHEDGTGVIKAGGESSGHIPDTDLLRSRESNNEKTPLGVVDEAGSLLPGSIEENKADKVESLEPQNDRVGLNSSVISPCFKAGALDCALTDVIMTDVQESLSVEERDSTKDTNGPTGNSSLPAVTSGLLHPQNDSVERPSDSPPAAEISKDERPIGEHEICTEDLGAVMVAVASSSVEPIAMSSVIAVESTQETKKGTLVQKSVDSEEASRNSSGAMEDASSKQMAQLTHKSDKYDSEALSGLPGDRDRHQEDESVGVFIHADDEVKKGGKDANIKKRVKRRKRHSSRSMTVSQRLGAIDKSTADIDLGIVDALEVATQVALEVAREVDSREPSCDSSEELSDETGLSGSSNSLNEEQDTLGTTSPSKEAPVGGIHSVKAPPGGQGHLMDLKDNTPENGVSGTEIEQCQVSAKRSPCDFDLNEEFSADETDVAVSAAPTLTPVVTVSCPVTASGVPPEAVSQLEKTVGWKGSAATTTSAFHSASPHKVSGDELREKQVCLGIDLNVAEGGDDKAEDSTPWKQFSFLSNVRFTESPVEAKPAESGRFNLDLNCMHEDDALPPSSESRMETRLFLNRNGHQSSSGASSSSSAQQVAKKANIDLNDGPQFLIDSSNQGPHYGQQHSWGSILQGGHKSDEPVISILGAKVEVNRKDHMSTLSSFLPKPNGKSLDRALDLNIRSTGNSLGLAPSFSYSPSPTYSYNGLTAPPGMSFSSPMYVPGDTVPYMMDSRGASMMMPQVIGSTPHVQTAYGQQHYFMSMPGASPSLNGLGQMRPTFDRSSGFGVEGGSRETLSLRQFLSPGQSGHAGEHAGASGEASTGSSMVGAKRKEPETGWEPYTHNSRPQYPPWR